jgi:hypothetical protein
MRHEIIITNKHLPYECSCVVLSFRSKKNHAKSNHDKERLALKIIYARGEKNQAKAIMTKHKPLKQP